MQIKFLTARNFVFQRFQFFSCLCPHSHLWSLPPCRSLGLLSGCLHETIFSGLPSFGVVNSDVVNGPDRAAH